MHSENPTRRQALRTLVTASGLIGASTALASSAVTLPQSVFSLGNFLSDLEIPEAVKKRAKTEIPASTTSTPVFHGKERAYAEFVESLNLEFIKPSELIAPHRKIRRGVSNSVPPKHLWKNMAPTLRAADEMRRRLGVPLRCINSAYRSPAYNATCKGAARRSTHMKNQALDLVFDCSPRRAARVAKQLRKEGFFKGGVGTYRSFVHIDSRGTNATW